MSPFFEKCQEIIYRNKKLLEDLCQNSEINGFRAPFLKPPKFLFKILGNLEFKYDSSIKSNKESKYNHLNKFHIQGKDISRIRLGAFYNNVLLSVMTFSVPNISKGSKNKKDVWELNRFCSDYNYHIPGIASKFLTCFKRNYDWKEIFSYADRRWSNGNLYYKLGFNLEHITKPNYWYTKGYVRIHRFNLRKKPTEPKEISELILRYNEGFRRVWDCGNLKFIIIN